MLFPERRGDLKKYLDVAALLSPASGMLAPLLAAEAENFRRTGEALDHWRERQPSATELASLQADLAQATLHQVKGLLTARGVAPPLASPGASQ